MASVHAIMSVPKLNSCGSCAAAITRTLSWTSSDDGWLLGSVPMGRRTEDHHVVSVGGERGGEVVHVPTESA